MKKVIIFGNANLAEVAHHYLKADSNYCVAGFTVNERYINEIKFHNLPVVPFEHIENYFPPSTHNLFAPISYSQMNNLREKIFFEGKQKGYDFITYIHSSIKSYAKKIGENCFILENNTLQPYVEISDNVIIWSGNHIGHHSKIEENVFISSHVVVSGNVTIGKNTFLGVNSTIRDNVLIGSHCLIGAGSLVLTDLAAASVIKQKSSELSTVPSYRIKI